MLSVHPENTKTAVYDACQKSENDTYRDYIDECSLPRVLQAHQS